MPRAVELPAGDCLEQLLPLGRRQPAQRAAYIRSHRHAARRDDGLQRRVAWEALDDRPQLTRRRRVAPPHRLCDDSGKADASPETAPAAPAVSPWPIRASAPTNASSLRACTAAPLRMARPRPSCPPRCPPLHAAARPRARGSRTPTPSRARRRRTGAVRTHGRRRRSARAALVVELEVGWRDHRDPLDARLGGVLGEGDRVGRRLSPAVREHRERALGETRDCCLPLREREQDSFSRGSQRQHPVDTPRLQIGEVRLEPRLVEPGRAVREWGQRRCNRPRSHRCHPRRLLTPSDTRYSVAMYESRVAEGPPRRARARDGEQRPGRLPTGTR